MATTANPTPPQPDPNTQPTRLREVKQFDESKIGVKGLVDRGISTIPSFFVHPNPNPKSTPATKPDPSFKSDPKPTIPVIDFSSPRSTIVDELRRASSSLGFFQIINHSVPPASINKVLGSIQEFFEQPEEIKMEYYSRDMKRGAVYSTNFDLYQSKAASWRDTLQMGLSPDPPKWENVPVTCREAVAEWDEQVVKISEEVMEILCEGLGLEKQKIGNERLTELTGGRVMAAHYYPYCPQPELTAGLTSHTDPGLLTVLVQNLVPGLQVKVGEEWADVVPVEGAIVFNIGDILQIMSNDQYRSVEHRVLANPLRDPRASVAIFLKPSLRDQLLGPFPEIVSAEKPAVYRQFTLSDYMGRFFTKELDGKTLTNYYRIMEQQGPFRDILVVKHSTFSAMKSLLAFTTHLLIPCSQIYLLMQNLITPTNWRKSPGQVSLFYFCPVVAWVFPLCSSNVLFSSLIRSIAQCFQLSKLIPFPVKSIG